VNIARKDRGNDSYNATRSTRGSTGSFSESCDVCGAEVQEFRLQGPQVISALGSAQVCLADVVVVPYFLLRIWL
jgi:hypothetical protein